MTVQQLINKLQTCNPDSKVFMEFDGHSNEVYMIDEAYSTVKLHGDERRTLIFNFVHLTQAHPLVAEQYLVANGWKLEQAVSHYRGIL